MVLTDERLLLKPLLTSTPKKKMGRPSTASKTMGAYDNLAASLWELDGPMRRALARRYVVEAHKEITAAIQSDVTFFFVFFFFLAV